jgi:hypothetical protein
MNWAASESLGILLGSIRSGLGRSDLDGRALLDFAALCFFSACCLPALCCLAAAWLTEICFSRDKVVEASLDTLRPNSLPKRPLFFSAPCGALVSIVLSVFNGVIFSPLYVDWNFSYAFFVPFILAALIL